jgi:hypothetical protein
MRDQLEKRREKKRRKRDLAEIDRIIRRERRVE